MIAIIFFECLVKIDVGSMFRVSSYKFLWRSFVFSINIGVQNFEISHVTF